MQVAQPAPQLAFCALPQMIESSITFVEPVPQSIPPFTPPAREPLLATVLNAKRPMAVARVTPVEALPVMKLLVIAYWVAPESATPPAWFKAIASASRVRVQVFANTPTPLAPCTPLRTIVRLAVPPPPMQSTPSALARLEQ